MRLYHDLDLGYFTAVRGGTAPLRRIHFKAGDETTIEVEFFKSGTAHIPASVDEIIFVIKDSYADDAAPLALAPNADWSSGDGIHTAALDVNTAEIRAALGSASGVTLKAELTVTLDGVGPATTATVPCLIANDLWKGDEGTPLSLPTPDEWLAERQNAVIRSTEEGDPNIVRIVVRNDDYGPLLLTWDALLQQYDDGDFLVRVENIDLEFVWRIENGDVSVAGTAPWPSVLTELVADDWTMTDGTAPSSIELVEVAGAYVGQWCRVGDDPGPYTWYRWDGATWVEDAAGGTMDQSAIQTAITDKPAFRGNIGAMADTNTALNAAIAEDPVETLKASKSLGARSLLPPHKKYWKLLTKLARSLPTTGTPTHASRFRVLSLGDSQAISLNKYLESEFGYGGRHSGLLSITTPWPGESGGIPRAIDQWARTPNGIVVTINAGTAGQTYIQNITGPVMHSVIVHYLASSTTGSFKLQYQVNRTGGWVDATTATVSTDGGSAASGVINTNNGTTEKFSQAIFTLPKSDFYNIRLQAVTGSGNAPVYLCDVMFNNGGHNMLPAGGIGNVPGATYYDWAQGGRDLATHFSQTPAQTWLDALPRIDPHLIIYRSSNNAFKNVYETYWPTYAARILAGAPNATLVVCGNHTMAGRPTWENADSVAFDDYLRQWCVDNNQIFVDVRANFPEYVDNPSSVDDLWTDGLHTYGDGNNHISALIVDAIRPAIDYYKKALEQTFYNLTSVVPGYPTEIRLDNPDGYSDRKSQFWFVCDPRSSAIVGIRPHDAPWNGGGQYWQQWSGFGKATSVPASGEANSLFLVSNGWTMGAFSSRGATFGYAADPARAYNGWRFLTTDNNRPSLVAEGKSGQTAFVFGIQINATANAEGTNLWNWFADGRCEYEGVTSNAFKTTFTQEEPTASVTIHRPTCATAGTGTHVRTIGIIPSYATQAAGNAAVGVAEVFYAEDVKKVFTRLS